MKKAVVIILIALPIFLMISISIAGRILSNVVDVREESVDFVDDFGDVITHPLEIGLHASLQLKVRVLPENAKPKLTFQLADSATTVCTVSGQGIVTGRSYGSAKVIVVTGKQKLQATVEIIVTDRNVERVQLSVEEKSLSIGESFQLEATVLPVTAVDKYVTWSSSDPEAVSVSATGKIYARKATEQPVIVTVTTRDGAKTDTCAVTVTGKIVLAFAREGEDEPIPPGYAIVVRSESIRFIDYLLFDEQRFPYSAVTFRLIGGSGCVLTDDVLRFGAPGASAIIEAEVFVENEHGTERYVAQTTFRLRVSE